MKPEGYLVTAETFKLKTIFKHPKKNRHVVFYAESLGRDGDEVMLNNNNLITVRPGACNQPYFTVVMSRSKHRSSSGKENSSKMLLATKEVIPLVLKITTITGVIMMETLSST